MDKEKNQSNLLLVNVQRSIVSVRGQQIIIDADVAHLYGVETKRINEAVRNNPDKFPSDYMFILTKEEVEALRSKNSSTNLSSKSRSLPKAFTEKGLYMLATILKSKNAIAVTFAIVETFANVRELKRQLRDLHQETDNYKQNDKINSFGELLSDIVAPDLEVAETESSVEINFFVGKIKHTVKRVKRAMPPTNNENNE
ncbi:MAG: ORF6N domain-containing protein [Prevotella histicola]|nr:ORF6N domain-containing protein [Prevotella histicola]